VDTITLPILPLRDVVIFPHMMMPFIVGRASSVQAVEDALLKDKRIFVATQRDAADSDPQPQDIYTTGCVATLVQSLALPDRTLKVLVEGVNRGIIVRWSEESGSQRVVVQVLPRARSAEAQVEPLMKVVVSLFERYVRLSNKPQSDAMIAAVRVDDPNTLADTVAAHMRINVSEKQDLLDIGAPEERLRRIETILAREVDILEVEQRVKKRMVRQIRQLQTEFYAAHRKKAIASEIEELQTQLSTEPPGSTASTRIAERLNRLAAMAREMETQGSAATFARSGPDLVLGLVRDAAAGEDELDDPLTEMRLELALEILRSKQDKETP
jgi:ATP-dependent Lon protease